jgi:hypothetical protein
MLNHHTRIIMHIITYVVHLLASGFVLLGPSVEVALLICFVIQMSLLLFPSLSSVPSLLLLIMVLLVYVFDDSTSDVMGDVSGGTSVALCLIPLCTRAYHMFVHMGYIIFSD